MTTQPPCLTVFFDGACPMCRREIAYYQRLDTRQRVGWQDVSAPASGQDCPDGLCRADMLKRFHVMDSSGQVFSGAAGFVQLWRVLPAPWSLLGRIAGLPGLVQLLELVYRAFLPVRPWLQRRFNP